MSKLCLSVTADMKELCRIRQHYYVLKDSFFFYCRASLQEPHDSRGIRYHGIIERRTGSRSRQRNTILRQGGRACYSKAEESLKTPRTCGFTIGWAFHHRSSGFRSANRRRMFGFVVSFWFDFANTPPIQVDVHAPRLARDGGVSRVRIFLEGLV